MKLGMNGVAEMKELMKIEDICMFSTDNYTDKERETLCEGCTVSCKYNPAAWNEENKEMIDKIIDYMKPMPIFFESTKGESDEVYTKEFIENAIDWLKSLKNKYTWKFL